MIEMFLYILSIMYSPGPMNFLAINIGIKNRIKESIGFYFGIACAAFSFTALFAYSGEKLIKEEYMV